MSNLDVKLHIKVRNWDETGLLCSKVNTALQSLLQEIDFTDGSYEGSGKTWYFKVEDTTVFITAIYEVNEEQPNNSVK
jgi:hypothetical protein